MGVRRKHCTVSTQDFYEHYVENQTPGEFTLGYDKWKKVIYELLYLISISLIKENLILKLDFNLGFIGIEKAKGKAKRRIDFGGTRKAGHTVFHTNLHTDCFYFRFAWRRRRHQYKIMKNLLLYKFKPVQGQNRDIGKRGLAKWIKKCATDPYIKDYDAPAKI